MQDTINKYYILIYENGKEIFYGTYATTELTFNAYKIYMTLRDIMNIENEYNSFCNWLKIFGLYWSENYDNDLITTAFILNANKYDYDRVKNDEDIKHLNHNELHIKLHNRIMRENNLKLLLDENL